MNEPSWILPVTGARSIRRAERVQSLWSGYGEILRVELDGGSAPSVIVKWVRPPSSEVASGGVSHARKCRSYDVELRFYRDYAPRTDASCRTPRLLNAQSERAEWRLVLEDLDASGYSARRRVLSAEEIERCLTWLAHFHARFVGVRPRGLWRSGTYWHLATRRDELERIGDAELRRAAPILDRRLNGARHQTLVHGDAKVANFCFSPDGARVAAVDFQYVGGGVGVKDVAYLLSDHPAPHSESTEQRFLDRYFAALRSALESSAVDGVALESEWRSLYPIARADYHRFLAGWAPREYENDAHARRLVARALAALR